MNIPRVARPRSLTPGLYSFGLDGAGSWDRTGRGGARYWGWWESLRGGAEHVYGALGPQSRMGAITPRENGALHWELRGRVEMRGFSGAKEKDFLREAAFSLRMGCWSGMETADLRKYK